MWTLVALNILCTCLPILAFASPATVFIPAFWPDSLRWKVLSRDTTDNIKQNAADNEGVATFDETFENDESSILIEMPPLALTTQMLQCYLFAIYAFHFQMWTLFIPNSVGFMLGFIWSTLYPLKVSPDLKFLKQWKIQYSVSIFVMAAGSLTIHNLPYISSTIAAAVGVLMCSYPLPVLHRSYTESNPKLLGSVFMNIAMLTCCSAWVIHSSPLVDFDIYVLLSNASGVAVQGGALLIRSIIARRKESIPSEESPLL
eukprot:CCRYP_009418-RA/>CCRYP_009418-RA protein AED:0.00 eAED:0.00 QI:119/-1/1/1/-1/0/1/55/257